MAVAGDIDIEKFTIKSSRGSVDLANESKMVMLGCRIYESAVDLDTYGDILILDENDVLGQNKISGDEEVEISFKHPGGKNPATYKMKMVMNNDLKHEGAMKSKTYSFKIVSPEILNNKSVRVAKSYNTQTSDMVKDVVKNFLKSDKEVKIEDETKGQQRFIANSVTPYQMLNQLKTRHVSQKNESSSYTLFQTRDKDGKQIYKFTTFEEMMSKEPELDITYKQDNTVGDRTTTTKDDFTNIIDMYVPDSFNTMARFDSPSAQSSYNFHTGKQQKVDKKTDDVKFKTLGESAISKDQRKQYDETAVNKKPIRHTFIEPSNDKQKTNIAEMKPKRAAFMAEALQNVMKMEVPGNSDLKPGMVIKVNIPKKADTNDGSEETQMTGKVLITRVVHSIGDPSATPRYTCIVECIKAGYEEKI